MFKAIESRCGERYAISAASLYLAVCCIKPVGKQPSIVFFGVIFLLLGACDIQRAFIYYPGRTTISDVQSYVADNNLAMWPENGSAYRGIISRKGPAFFKGTVVVFHGSAGPAMFRHKRYFTALESRGYRVVLAEYPGYGGRSGELNEESLVADARRTALRAKEDFGGPLYAWGESLGCAVASGLAADLKLRPRGVVLVTPWDSFQNEAESKCPWLPAGFSEDHKYDNLANLWSFRGKVAVMMCELDEVIPNRLTERLYTSLPQSKQLWIFKNAGHSNWPHGPELQWWDEVMDFLESAG